LGSGEGGTGSGKISDPAVNAELQLLRKQISTLTNDNAKFKQERDQEKAARLETERSTAIRNVLNGIEFRDQESRDLVFSAITGMIKRDEEGNLVAQSADGPVTYDAFFRGYVDKLPNLLAPKGGGGSSATGGTRTGSGKGYNLDTMSPSQIAALKPEERAALYKGVGDLLNSQLSPV
jgi:hypothetical protein